MARRSLRLLVLLFLLPSGTSRAQRFEEDFEALDDSLWQLAGTARHDEGTESVVLTPPTSDQYGGLFYVCEPITLDQVTITFTAEISKGTGADGIAMFVVAADTPPPLSTGGGSTLGIGSMPGPIFHVELDTYSGCGDREWNGVAGNHIGVGYSAPGYLGAGGCPTTQASLTANPGFDLEDTGPITVQVEFERGHVTVSVQNQRDMPDMTPILKGDLDNWTVPFEGLLGFAAACGGLYDRHEIHHVRVYEKALPCAKVRRSLPSEKFFANVEFEVTLTISDVCGTPADPCTPPFAPETVTITEALPDGWVASAPTAPGVVGPDDVVNWTFANGTFKPGELRYKVLPYHRCTEEKISGKVTCSGFDRYSIVGGAGRLRPECPIDGNGFVVYWLLLGPYRQTGGDDPGDALMQQDFLTDGIQIHEVDVMPYAGMQVKTDYTVAAATGLYTSATVPDLRDDINVDGIPTWFRWEDPDDTIAFNSSVPAAFLTPGVNQSSPQQCMAYACCYVWNNSGEVLPVHIGCGSDDSIAIILRDEYVWVHSIPRGWGAPREIQDLVTAMPNGDPIILMPGENRLMVKVFEGTGGWGFRLRFQDERGEPILPPTIGVKLRPIPASVPILRSFSSAAYTPGDTVRVALTLSGVKDPPPAAVKIMETLPLGWTATTASDSGIIQGQTITWNLTGAAIANGRRLAYEVPAPKGITAIFKGTYEVEADQFPVTGATTLPRAPIPAENLSPWIAADIGTPLAGGQEKISDTSFNIWGGGADISSRSDSFRFIHRSSTGGDMTMWVRVEGQDATGAGAKAGLMVRQSLEPGSPFYFVQVTPKDGAGPRYRTSLNGNAGPALPISAEADLPLWLKLVRKSNSFTAFTSTDGTTWEQNFRTATHKNPRAITMTEPVLVGFAVTAGDAAKVSGVMFRDFHCDAPFCGDGPLGVFHRGDVDGTGGLTIGDAIFLLNYQFAGGAVPPCLDACDTDDSGSLTIGDPIYLLGYMFAGGPAPPAPGPPGSPCGRDLTGGPLGCESYPPAACQ